MCSIVADTSARRHPNAVATLSSLRAHPLNIGIAPADHQLSAYLYSTTTCSDDLHASLGSDRPFGSSTGSVYPYHRTRTSQNLPSTAILIRVDPAANSQRGRTNLPHLQA